MELELRLLILLLGIVLLILIYVWGMRRRIQASLKNRQRRQSRSLNEPVLETEHSAAVVTTEQTINGGVADEQTEAVAEAADDLPPKIATTGHSADIVERIGNRYEPDSGTAAASATETDAGKVNVVLLLLAEPGQVFKGATLLRVFRELELNLNHKGIWNCHVDGEARDKPVFGIGHLKEPGHFKLATMTDLTTPGLLLFMSLPGPVTAVTAVELMIKTADRLVEQIGGIVCDERGQAITTNSLAKLRAEAAAFDRQHAVPH